MDLIVRATGEALWGALRLRCALGRSGISRLKREGDGATPAGRFPFRRLLYRADRIAAPRSRLGVQAIAPGDGWCDDPADPRYNRQVTLPCPARHERLWRQDRLYDLLVVIGHNDAPVVAGAGSAVFLHAARTGYAPTEGCVAFALADLRGIVEAVAPGDAVSIQA